MPEPTPGELEAFIAAEHARLVGLLALHVGSRPVAEELAQDAFRWLCEHWPRVSDMDNRPAWLRRVALNLANSWLRRRYAEARIAAATNRMVACVAAAGHEVVTRDENVGPAQRFGVEVGEWVDVPTEQPPATGTWTVVREGPTQRYEPTPEEVELARAWVACRDQTGFDTVLVERVRVAQLDALTVHDETIRDLDARIDETLRAIDASDAGA